MGDDFWKYGLPALMAFLGVAVTKLLEVIAQRRKAAGQLELNADEFTWGMAQTLMKQYKTDLQEVRAELVAVRLQVTERDRKIEMLEEQVATLQSQNAVQNQTIARLQAELDMLKGPR